MIWSPLVHDETYIYWCKGLFILEKVTNNQSDYPCFAEKYIDEFTFLIIYQDR